MHTQVTNHSISALRFYQFANYLLGGIAAAALLPMVYTMYTAYERLYWLSIVVVLTQAALQLAGTPTRQLHAHCAYLNMYLFSQQARYMQASSST